MRIGILTFQRAINYGAVLQAYALQQTLRSLGHEVWVINYRQPRVERTDRRPFLKGDKWRLLKEFHLRSFLNFDREKKKTLERRERFDDFLNKYLCLTELCGPENIPDFDIYIVGSDQVWNSSICDGLDPVFWGKFKRPDNSRFVSYAASTSVDDLKKQSHLELQNLLKNFSYISVREKETSEYLNKNFTLKNSALTVLDPTLLAKKDIWDMFDNDTYKGHDYVLYFGARSCADYPTVLKDKALSLAKDYGCDLISINFNADSPVDFINKFRYAKAVVTSSFHGVAFSLIFNRPLYAVQYGDEQDARYVNVLKSIGAVKMLVGLRYDVHPQEFDYDWINTHLEIIRKKSLKYLQEL